jgi:uncharacterized protein (DUF302 family)
MNAGEGIVNLPSKYSVSETLDRLETVLRSRAITVFARVDHAGGAVAVGLTMPPSELLIFGSPQGGTPIMLAAPTAAIDLPFKALAWQDGDGKVWVSYNEPAYLAARFGLTDEQIKTIKPLVALIEQATS